MSFFGWEFFYSMVCCIIGMPLSIMLIDVIACYQGKKIHNYKLSCSKILLQFVTLLLRRPKATS